MTKRVNFSSCRAIALSHAVVSGETESDDVYLVGGRALVINSGPARWEGADVGAVMTVRDRTELQSVSGELDVVRRLTSALRAQHHESANRLHTVVSLIEMDRSEKAIEVATQELQIAQLLADQVIEDVGDPVLAALLLGTSAEAAERGASLEIVGEVSEQRCTISGRDLITVVGTFPTMRWTRPAMPLPAGCESKSIGPPSDGCSRLTTTDRASGRRMPRTCWDEAGRRRPVHPVPEASGLRGCSRSRSDVTDRCRSVDLI